MQFKKLNPASMWGETVTPSMWWVWHAMTIKLLLNLVISS